MISSQRPQAGAWFWQGNRREQSTPRLAVANLADASMTTNIIQGGCLCGAVRYKATGQPYNITHCHCTDCRRSSGAAFVTWASFRQTEFHFTQGEPRVLPWAGRLRSFCAACGTPLTFMTTPDADEVDVTVCTFVDPGAISPSDHTWVEDRLPWIRLADDLPVYERERSNPAD